MFTPRLAVLGAGLMGVGIACHFARHGHTVRLYDTDPQRLAEGIIDPQEALEIYYVSCAVIDIDHFMERSYLNALGDALALPKDVRADIEQDIQSQKQALSV